MIENRILITGATGFIGRELIPTLKSYQLCALVRDEKKARSLFSNSIGLINCNDFNSELIQKIQEFNPNYVIHLAGNSSSGNSFQERSNLIDSNIKFGALLLEAISNCEIKCFMNVSSSLAYDGEIPKATNFYSSTKLAFSEILKFDIQQKNTKLIELVLYNVYGANDTSKRAINYVMESLDNFNASRMSPGEQKMDFIYIDDVVSLFSSILIHQEKLPIFSRFHVGTSIPTSIKELAKIIEKLSNKTCNIIWGGIDYRKNEKMFNVAPMQKIPFWEPKVNLETGLKKILSTINTIK